MRCAARLPSGQACGKPIGVNGKCITGRKGAVWRKQAATIYREETHCWICKRPVDKTLHHNHKRAKTVDHKNGDRHDCRRINLALAHRNCNTIKGDSKPTKRRNSRKW